MIAAPYRADDAESSFDCAVREELNAARLEAIAIASVISPADLAKRMGITVAEARKVREAAKRHVRELWAFEDAAFERE